jgi:hypothetical protein
MEAVTETRIKDDAKELAEKPSGGDSGDNLGGAPGQESGTATTGTAAAATETTKTDKEGMPGTNSGQDQDGGLGGSGGGQSTTYVEFPRGNNYVPVYYMSEGTAAIKYSTNDIVLKNIYWQTTGSGGNKIANAAYKSGDDNPELTKGFQKGVLL